MGRSGKITKINLELLNKYQVRYDWCTIFVGVKLGFLKFPSITDYAILVMGESDYESDDLINDLAWEINEENLNYFLSKINEKYCNIDVEDKKWEKELRRLRYCALSYLHDTIDDKSELLKAISLLYDTLNYPEDMVSFIDYMPPTKTDESLSPHDNLLKNFNDFMEKEREFL